MTHPPPRFALGWGFFLWPGVIDAVLLMLARETGLHPFGFVMDRRRRRRFRRDDGRQLGAYTAARRASWNSSSM